MPPKKESKEPSPAKEVKKEAKTEPAEHKKECNIIHSLIIIAKKEQHEQKAEVKKEEPKEPEVKIDPEAEKRAEKEKQVCYSALNCSSIIQIRAKETETDKQQKYRLKYSRSI